MPLASTNCVGTVWWVWIVTVDSGLGGCIGDFHELLSEVLAGKQTQQRFRRIMQAIRNVLLVHETAVPLPTAQRLQGLGNPRGIIKPGEALHARTPGHQIGVVRWAGLR